MTPKTTETSSNRALRATLRKAGISWVSASQIERWQKLGLLPPTRRRGRGQGGGSVSSYPPGTVAQVRALLRILKRHRNLDKVAVLLKLHGYQVSAAALIRATRRLVFDQFEKLDPQGKRRWTPPKDVSSAAAETALKRRLRSDDDKAARRQELELAGGRNELQAHYGSALLPVLGGLDPAGLLRALDVFGLGAIARSIRDAIPDVTDELARMAKGGAFEIDHVREASKTLTVDQFDTLISCLRALAMAVEASGLHLSHSDPFASDVLDALREPEQRRQRSLPKDEDARRVEQEALAFFAKRRKAASRARAGGDAQPHA
jgi:DNA-binding transcriptional MerR regulator